MESDVLYGKMKQFCTKNKVKYLKWGIKSLDDYKLLLSLEDAGYVTCHRNKSGEVIKVEVLDVETNELTFEKSGGKYYCVYNNKKYTLQEMEQYFGFDITELKGIRNGSIITIEKIKDTWILSTTKGVILKNGIQYQ